MQILTYIIEIVLYMILTLERQIHGEKEIQGESYSVHLFTPLVAAAARAEAI